ncbi:response regulator [Nocardia sp. NPDC127579]|uniref:response regulator n=1 Tax=Nocardia sp. NPDC127579 TaxID=3345402 RepID=UPI003645E6DB
MIERSISVVIVDDHTLLRVALRDMLQLESDIEVVADVPDGRTGVDLVRRWKPDVIVLDVEIPGETVRENIADLLEVSPDSRILIVSMYQDIGLIRELADSGISGYLHKSASRESLLANIRAIHGGERHSVAVMSAQALHLTAATEPALTDRELQILGHVADALSNRQIAGKLGISEGTVKRHLANIFQKLGAVSRLDAVNRAVAAKVIRASAGVESARSGGARPAV